MYDEIANHFSETRHSPWPKVKQFIESFPNGSVVVDIGCGNGKYLSLNDSIVKVGKQGTGHTEYFTFYKQTKILYATRLVAIEAMAC